MRHNHPDMPVAIADKTPLSALFLFDLFESMGKGLAVFEDGQIIYANGIFNDIFDISSNGDDPLSQIKAIVLQHTYSDSLNQFFTSGTSQSFEFQSSLTQKWYVLKQSTHPIQSQYKLLVCTDISAYRRRDELMCFANKMESLGQMAGGVAHDFNNILSIIEGYSRLLIARHEEGSEVRTYSQRIVQAAKRGASLTRQLLTFGTHKVFAEGTICLNDFLAEQETLIRPLLDCLVNLTIECPQDRILVGINAEQLSQIFINAVTNARDALGGQKGDIRIAVKPAASHAILTISDTGCGMDEETLSRAMDPFFTTKAAGKGTGLGLSQIYGIMQQVGGTITIHSKPQQGTDIILHLPYGQPKNITSEDLDQPINTHPGQTVLIADDEPDVVEVMRQMLEEYGFNVLCAANGNDALAIQDSYPHKIDWLLSDVVMPDMSGPKLGGLMEAVRPDTKIIYMSGYPATGQMARITLPNDALFLAKPIDPRHLMTIMNNLSEDGESISPYSDGLARLAGAWNFNTQE